MKLVEELVMVTGKTIPGKIHGTVSNVPGKQS
jgi:hypothetical protein